jgi:putative membrane protein
LLLALCALLTPAYPMRGFHDKYFEEVSRVVAGVEETCTAEIVVAVEPQSGSYRDVDLAAGAGLGFLGLAALLYNPWSHPEHWVLIDTALLFALGAWVTSAVPWLRRALTRPARREAQVRAAAGAAFHEERVWTTRARTGILIYVSLMERLAVVIADHGIAAAVPAPDWNRIAARLRSIGEMEEPSRALLEGLQELGTVLAAALPPTEDNPDELPNRVRSGR